MSYHEKMMNVETIPSNMNVYSQGGYKIGHRDARHACAEVALEADRRIEQLEAALRFYAEPHNYKYGDYESAVIHDAGDIARKALEQ